MENIANNELLIILGIVSLTILAGLATYLAQVVLRHLAISVPQEVVTAWIQKGVAVGVDAIRPTIAATVSQTDDWFLAEYDRRFGKLKTEAPVTETVTTTTTVTAPPFMTPIEGTTVSFYTPDETDKANG
jgi:hypothetical protein